MNCSRRSQEYATTPRDFTPSVKACSERVCFNLISESNPGRGRRKVCGAAPRPSGEGHVIPGNLKECPRDALELRMCPISLNNTIRDISVSGFLRGLVMQSHRHIEGYWEESQEIISCIVKAAREAGYEIPEAGQ